MRNSWLKYILKTVYWLLTGCIWFWALGLYLYGLESSAPLRWTAALAWLVLGGLLVWAAIRLRRGYWLPLLALMLPCTLWFSLRPGRIEIYRSEQARIPWGEFHGREVVLHDLRACRYLDAERPLCDWYDVTVNLDSLERIDFFLVYFAAWRGVAHTFLSFGFAGGEQVALSVEARRAAGEPYAILPGLYRRFELMYLLGDELDIVGRRLHHEGDPIYMLPITAPPEKLREYFVSVLNTANQLWRQPEHYNTLTSTCTNQLVMEANPLREDPISLWDWRLFFPGYSGEVAQEAGLLDLTGPLPEVLEQYRVDPARVRGESRERFSRSLHALDRR